MRRCALTDNPNAHIGYSLIGADGVARVAGRDSSPLQRGQQEGWAAPTTSIEFLHVSQIPVPA
jgi:hypothetical protein